ncbi:PAC2 family protein [Tomitella cavernea]|uniref:PAC2 family protein n=1 Tax=Tomitella cavernea TaxID=1387982 RepID=A0ABP9CNA5_9ACTN
MSSTDPSRSAGAPNPDTDGPDARRRDGEDPADDGPIVVAAFEGWNDAADAATGLVEHLALIGGATPLAELDSEGYYDYQVNRPTISQISGVTRRITWPATRLTRCRLSPGGRELILVHGIEPNLRWRAFCAELLDLFTQAGVAAVVTVGALLADTPHTRPVPITGSTHSAAAAKLYGLTGSDYEGPTGITGVLQDACVRAGIPATTLWAAVPHYLSQPPNPKVMVALMRRLEQVLGFEIPAGDLPRQAEEWQDTARALTEEDEDIAEYVQALEERGDEQTDISEMLRAVDGDEIAAEFERYLRRQGPGRGPDPGGQGG